MKNYKIGAATFLSVALLTLATSCGDDEEVKTNDGGSRTELSVNGKYLVRVNSFKLEYNAQGLLGKIKWDVNGGYAEMGISYEPKRIITSNPDVIYYLEGGRITEASYSVQTSMENDAPIIDAKDTYEYDNDGYLIKAIKPYDFAEEGPYMETTVYEWRNGNINRITRSHYDFQEEVTISYTAYPNTIPDLTQGFIGNYLAWEGYFGNRCKNLPESETWHSENYFPDKTITYHYDYTFEDGVVTKVTVSWTSGGKPSSMVHELKWY